MTQLQFNTALLGLHDKLFYYAYSLTSDKEKSQDLLQETFLKALKYRGMFTHNTNFTAWIYTIMKNIFINDYRRNERARLIFKDTGNEDSQKFEDQVNYVSPESLYISSEILKYINLLEDGYKVPFKLFLEGFKYKEIAETVGIPIGTVKSRIFFARKLLRTSLGEYTVLQKSYSRDS